MISNIQKLTFISCYEKYTIFTYTRNIIIHYYVKLILPLCLTPKHTQLISSLFLGFHDNIK